MTSSVSDPLRRVRVFLASPGDLIAEREAFLQTCLELSKERAGVVFEPLRWEDLAATTGVRPQSAIDEFVDSCDVFLLAMHRRWGQETADASPATSYTEAELRRAISRLERTGTPEVFCFFKEVDAASLADAGPQLKRVLALKRTRRIRVVFYIECSRRQKISGGKSEGIV